jgi:hypothetical protein
MYLHVRTTIDPNSEMGKELQQAIVGLNPDRVIDILERSKSSFKVIIQDWPDQKVRFWGKMKKCRSS